MVTIKNILQLSCCKWMGWVSLDAENKKKLERNTHQGLVKKGMPKIVFRLASRHL